VGQLEPRHDLFVDHLLAGKTVPEVAAELGVHRATCWRWLQVAAVQEELRRRRAERLAAVREEVGAAALESMRFLRGVVADSSVQTGARIRAACAILDRAGLPKRDGPVLTGLETWTRDAAEQRALDDLLSVW